MTGPAVALGMGMDVSTAVTRWRLEPHPEGGFFRETYRSPLTTLPPGWPGERALATAILYLLPAGERSAWHRVRGDELWLWQGGAARPGQHALTRDCQSANLLGYQDSNLD